MFSDFETWVLARQRILAWCSTRLFGQSSQMAKSQRLVETSRMSDIVYDMQLPGVNDNVDKVILMPVTRLFCQYYHYGMQIPLYSKALDFDADITWSLWQSLRLSQWVVIIHTSGIILECTVQSLGPLQDVLVCAHRQNFQTLPARLDGDGRLFGSGHVAIAIAPPPALGLTIYAQHVL